MAAALIVGAVALLAPASSQAASVTIGRANPATPVGGNCDPLNIYTQGKTAGPVLDKAPNAGVITSWSTRAGDSANQQVALKTISQTGEGGGAVFTVRATSVTQTLTPSTLNRFDTRITIQAGERIGYFIPTGVDNLHACDYNGVQNNNETAAGPSNGQTGNQFTNTLGSSQKLLNLEATIETDADGDGFGDDTQDRCLGVSGSNGGCPGGTLPLNPGADTTKPTLGRLSFARSSFAAASSGSAYTSRKKKRKKPPVGSKFSFNLSEASSVTFTVERKSKGRRVNRKCRTRTDKNKKKPKCTLYKKVSGSFTVNGKAGKNTITFRGRVGGRKLRTGSYRLTGTATDSAENASTAAKATFRIIK